MSVTKIFCISLVYAPRKELSNFAKLTKRTRGTDYNNAVIMGRKTFFSIPENRRPLADRINVVLTKNEPKIDYPPSVCVLPSLDSAMEFVDQLANIDTVWIIGGSRLYEEAMRSDRCHRVYLTMVEGDFACDTFFPEITDKFRLLADNDGDELMPLGKHSDNDIVYKYMIFERQ